MPLYHTHIDTLHLSFDSIDPINYVNINSNVYKIIPTTRKKDFNLSFDIYTTFNGRSVRFARIHHEFSLRPEYSVLRMNNRALYCSGWSNVLNQIIQDLRLNITVRKLEIAIDTNKNILKKLHTLYMNTNKIVINDKRYDFVNYGKTKYVKEQGYKYYYEHTATQKLHNTKSKTNSQFDRLENKSNEIEQKNHKQYIPNYLSNHLDTTKEILRFEKTLFFEDLSYKNTVWLNPKTGEILSNHIYKQLADALKSNYEKHKEICKLDIDFSKLEDSDYLTSIFNHFSLFNHEIVLDTYKNIPHFKAKYVKSYKKVKPTSRMITIANNQKTIIQMENELKEIDNLYTLGEISSLSLLKKQYEILFNTPIPSIYIDNRHNNKGYPAIDYWLR